MSSTKCESSLRPLFAQLGPISRADGSAQMSMGATTVMGGVYGPAEVRQHLEQTDRAAIEVTYRPKVMGGPGNADRVCDRAREALVRGACQAAVFTSAHPRTAIYLSLQQLDDAGGELACCVNAACMALLDAAIPMRALFAAVAVSVTGDVVKVDPDKKESLNSDAVITVVFESANLDILATHVEGRCSETKFQECLSAAKQATKAVFKLYKESFTKKFSKDLK